MNHDAAVHIAERADEWLERLKQPHDLNDRAEFLAWLKESPLHVREVLCATTWDKLLEHMLDPDGKLDIDALRRRGETNVVQFGNGIGREAPIAVELAQPRGMQHKRIGWSPLTGIAAAAACLTLVVMFGWSQLAPHPELQQQFGTMTGEQRSVGLSDGSIVHMNTQSRVRVAFSAEARDVHLLEGQAIFKVKHDTVRPFRVHVGSAVVQAIGTQFDVHRLKDRTSVAVIEGVVQIISGAESDDLNPEALSKLPENTKVPAGESVVIIADGKLLPHVAISPQDAGAWQQRRLIFHKQTLAEIAAEFNRYNHTPQIRIEGDALRARRLTGVFDADDPQSLLDYLSMDKQVAFDRTGNDLVIRMQGFAQTKPK